MTTQNPRYSYAIGAGWNTALASLTNPENLSQFVVRGLPAPPNSQPVNLFPIREITGSGKPLGHGRVDHAWLWTLLPPAALLWIENTFFSSGTLVYAQVTINTRTHNRGVTTYVRYNAWAELPMPGRDYTYDRTMFRNVTLRFYDLIASS